MTKRRRSSTKKEAPLSQNKEEENQTKEEEDTSQKKSSFYLDKAKDITSAIAGAATLAYAAGFVITNIYLGRKYGIYDFALIKSRYVYTGVTFSLFCFMTPLKKGGLSRLMRVW